ncbi:cell wall hydrolase [Sphingomonas sp. PB2P19]|uniref:cell wall hydrolase n=1 Tax=Sphingomonas rhamnosi TaxID=3096156 RepID=UPI002FCA5953
MAKRVPLSVHGLIGLPALILATSCVPDDHPKALARVQAVPDARTLLHRMALSVPDDIPAKALTDDNRRAAFTPVVAPAFTAARTADDAARAADCLTAAVYYEARSQSADGQRAVAQVVLNRVRDRAFPNTVCGVVYQGSQRRTGCQFSFTCDGSMLRPREPGAWDRARGIAEAALSGSVYAAVGAATSFHTTSILPWWASSLSRIATIGEHIFYRWQGGLERALTFRQAYAGFEPGAPSPAPAASATMAAGVTVHRGTEAVAGVTVHRGKTAPDATPQLVRVNFAGVRVHVGVHQPGVLDTGAEAATVGEESAPI